MDLECTAEPFKQHCILTNKRNKLTDEKGVVLFRARAESQASLHHARKAIKGKVYAGVLGTDSTLDAGLLMLP